VEQDKVNVKSPGISQNKIIASALGGIIATWSTGMIRV
jgi:hypothetical protein